MPIAAERRQEIVDKWNALSPIKKLKAERLLRKHISTQQAAKRFLGDGKSSEFDPERPELFSPTSEQIGEGLRSDLRTMGDLNPISPTNVVQRLFLSAISSGAPPQTGEGGLEAGESGIGGVPQSSTAVARTPVAPENIPVSLRPAPIIREEGGDNALLEFLAGRAPVQVVKAMLDTPGGPLSDPGLAIRRAKGAFLHEFSESPVFTGLDVAILPPIVRAAAKGVKAGARGTVRLAKALPEIIKDAKLARGVEATQAALDDMLNVARAEAEDHAKGKVKSLRIKRFVERQNRKLNDVAGYTQRDELKRALTQVEAELAERKKFPFAFPSTTLEGMDSGIQALKSQRDRLRRTFAPGEHPEIEKLTRQIAEAESKRNAFVNRQFPVAIQKEGIEETAEVITNAGKVADRATPIVAEALVPEAGPTVFKSGLIRDLFVSVRNRAKHPIARVLVQSFENAIADHHNLSGKWIENLRNVGVSRMDEATRIAVTEELNGIRTGNKIARGAALRIKPIIDDVAKEILALQKGSSPIMVRNADGSFRPWRPLSDFGAPRKLLPEIREALWSDAQTAMSKARARVGPKAKPAQLQAALESLHESGQLRMSAATEKAIDHLVASHWAQGPGEAWAFIARGSYDQGFRFFGHIDASRTAHWPREFYDRDITRIMTDYLYGAGRRVGESRHLGGRGEKMRNQLKLLTKASPEEGRFFSEVADSFLGQTDFDFAMNQKSLKGLYDFYTNFSVTTKIGLGTATIPNLTQFAISTLPVLGVENFAKGTLRIAFDAEYRSQLRASGALMRESMQHFMRLEFGGGGSVVTEFILKPFTGANKMQKYMAAAAMDQAYDDLARIAQNTAHVRNKEAVRFFSRLGVSPKQLAAPGARQRVMFRFAAETQLQRSVIADPFLFNQPIWRPFLLFKSFVLKQGKFIKDWVGGELVAGNAAPLLRLGVAGYFGGDMVRKAKEELREFLSGQPSYRIKGPWWSELLSRYSELGSVGVFSDLMRFDTHLPQFIMKDLAENAVFALTPLPASDIERVADIVVSGATEIGRRGAVTGGRRAAIKAISRFGGSLTGSLANRAKSDTQIDTELRSRANRTQSEVHKLTVNMEWEQATKLALEWNKRFPGYAVDLPTVEEWMKLKIRDQGRKKDLTDEQIRGIQRTLQGVLEGQ